MMEHAEIEELLAAYALDAVDPNEAMLIEAHLVECPRCQAELASHRDVASLLGNSATPAPHGVWDQIAARLDENDLPAPAALIARLPRQRRRTRAFQLAIAAAAAAAIAVLAVQVADLNSQEAKLQSPREAQALAPAVAAALAGPHETITLTSAKRFSGTIVVTSEGNAYWLSSNLPELPNSETYQLWGLVRDKSVSLGLLGSNVGRYSAFRVQRSTTEVMVTVEPEGGTPAPTSAVVLAGAVPRLA